MSKFSKDNWSVFSKPYSLKDLPPPLPDFERHTACLLLAGGLGTRLGFNQPKALYPIGKTPLIDLFLKELTAKAELISHDIHLAIMTSSFTTKALKEHVSQIEWLKNSRIHIHWIEQPCLPVTDRYGAEIIDDAGKPCLAPSGNGAAFTLLNQSGVLEKWLKQGIDSIMVTPIDNPLAELLPSDLPTLLKVAHADMAVRCIEKASSHEKVGLLAVNTKNQLIIVEYDEQRADSHFSPAYGFTGQMCVSAPFLLTIYQEGIHSLPYYPVQKSRKNHLGDSIQAIQSESRLFDLMMLSKKSVALLSSREKSFAPLKSSEGENGPEAVLKAYLKLKG